MKKFVKEDNYYCVQGWMVNNLGLSGNNLIVYAIIYGFSQTEEQYFSGSIRYLCEWTNSTKQGLYKNLKYLCDKGYLEKKSETINGVIFNKYRALIPKNNQEKICKTEVDTREQSLLPVEETDPSTKFTPSEQSLPPSEQSLPNNIDNNIDILDNTSISKDIEVLSASPGGDSNPKKSIKQTFGKSKLIQTSSCSKEELEKTITGTKGKTSDGEKPLTGYKKENYLKSVLSIVAQELNITDTDKLKEISDWFESIYDKGVTSTKGVRFRKCIVQLIEYFKKYKWLELSKILSICTQCAYSSLDWGIQKYSKSTYNKTDRTHFSRRLDETDEEYSERVKRDRVTREQREKLLKSEERV